MSHRRFFSDNLAPPRQVWAGGFATTAIPLFESSHDRQKRHYATRAGAMARRRLLIGGAVFCCCFALVGLRLGTLSLAETGPGQTPVTSGALSGAAATLTGPRADITDRHGVLLATSLPVDSLYADPGRIMDVEHAIIQIRLVFPDLEEETLRRRLTGPGRFVWIKRGLTPRQTDAMNRLGVPGLYFSREERRLYPQGRLSAHVTGFTDIDQFGLAGIEGGLDARLRHNPDPLALSLDIRVQQVLRRELAATMEKHQARGAAGLVLDIHTGAVLALASLPDFDPNTRTTMNADTLFNRVTLGVYEMGSTLKPFTVAMALETQTARVDDLYDVRKPLKVARFSIEDYQAMDRPLSVEDILIHSSNIGAAQLALDVGGERQRDFLERAGFFHRPDFEIAEVGIPIIPDSWPDITAMTVGFGHGLAINTLQLACGLAALTNGGILHPPTLLKTPRKTHQADKSRQTRLVSPQTSAMMRHILRAVVTRGTAGKADVPDYGVVGKTGTAEKVYAHDYEGQAVVSSFAGVFPGDDPRYLILTLFDEPAGTRETYGRATGGWVAAPTAGRVVADIGPMLGLPGRSVETPPPNPARPPGPEAILASY